GRCGGGGGGRHRARRARDGRRRLDPRARVLLWGVRPEAHARAYADGARGGRGLERHERAARGVALGARQRGPPRRDARTRREGPAAGPPSAAHPPLPPSLAEVGAPPGRLRIALQTDTWNGAPTHPTCREAARDAAKLCESLGHHVEEVRFEVETERFREATA